MNKTAQAIIAGLLLAVLVVLIFVIGEQHGEHRAIDIGRIEKHGVVYSVEKVDNNDNTPR
tara:strand:+ start:230 stop:409 length:180 start_codon:yes stop_codon:yes gene_type:complete